MYAESPDEGFDFFANGASIPPVAKDSKCMNSF